MNCLPDICCTCLATNGKYINIQDFDEYGDAWVEKLKTLVPEYMVPENFENILICSTCICDLTNSFKFRNMCLKSNVYLYQYIKLLTYTKNSVTNDHAIQVKKEPELIQNSDNEFVENTEISDTHPDKDTSSTTGVTKEKSDSEKKAQTVPPESNSDDLQQNNIEDSNENSDIEVEVLSKLEVTLETTNTVAFEKKQPRKYKYKNRNECDICHKKFTGPAKLTAHMLVHTGEKPYCCDICGKKYYQKGGLRTHMLIHTGERPYSCDVCSKKFSESHSLKSHMVIHTGERPYSCDICQKKFNRSYHLKIHILTHTGEKPYSCDVCNLGFNQSHHMKAHMLIHTGEKPFSCDVCKRKFNRNYHLKSHMLIHTGEKPYSCDACGKQFINKSSLIRHKVKHTEEETS